MKDIIVLTKKNCPMCKRVKMLLDKNGVIYKTLDAEDSVDGMAYVQFYGLGDSVLPRVIINEELLPAFETFEETVNAVLKSINLVPFVGREV